MRGRYPLGPEAAEQLDGSQQARDRLQVILEVIAGQLRVSEACDQLGISDSRLEVLRRRALQAAADALEPRPRGRPSLQPEARPDRVAELEARVADLDRELTLSRAREELASVRPPPEKKRRKARRS